MAARVRSRLTTAEARRFGLGVGSVFLVIAALLWWRGSGAGTVLAALAGLGLTLTGLVRPRSLEPVFRAWMGLARALSVVTTPITLAILYFLVFTPLAFIMRVAGRRPLQVGGGHPGFWSRRETARGDLERQF